MSCCCCTFCLSKCDGAVLLRVRINIQNIDHKCSLISWLAHIQLEHFPHFINMSLILWQVKLACTWIWKNATNALMMRPMQLLNVVLVVPMPLYYRFYRGMSGESGLWSWFVSLLEVYNRQSHYQHSQIINIWRVYFVTDAWRKQQASFVSNK